MLPVLAHAGHWAAQLVYAAPVVIVVIGLKVMSRIERRREAQEAEA